MDNNAFTANVKPGGLTSSTEIRVLICYILANVDAPLSRQDIEFALLNTELVNYFELAAALGLLLNSELISLENDIYTVTDSGRTVAESLASDLPFTVKEGAIKAAMLAQQAKLKNSFSRATYKKSTLGYTVTCTVSDAGGKLFECKLAVPDLISAKFVSKRFESGGDDIYRITLALLTDNKQLIKDYTD